MQTRQTIDQRMTLRRFVRVTIDNFRQLLQTISAPVTSLPMPPLPPLPPLPPPVPPAQPHAEPSFAAGSIAPRATEAGDTLGGEQVGGEPASDQPVGDQPVGDQPLGGEPLVDEPSGDEPLGGEPLGGEPLVDEPLVDDENRRGTRSAGGTSPLQQDPATADLVPAPPTSHFSSEPRASATGAPDDTSSPRHLVTSSPAHHPLPLPAALESLLFVSDEAVEPLRMAQALGIPPAGVEAALLALDAAYREERRGLRLQVRGGRYQLVTAPEAANLIETYLNLDASARLSAPALETLAVVAYRQPVTRSQIEAVRGVDCSGVLRSLIGRGLLEEVGRLDAPGRPVLYGVTDLFMHHFGLTALHELPPLEDTEIAAIEDAGA